MNSELLSPFISTILEHTGNFTSSDGIDKKLGGAVDSLEGKEALQRDLNRLEEQAINNIKFNMGNC